MGAGKLRLAGLVLPLAGLLACATPAEQRTDSSARARAVVEPAAQPAERALPRAPRAPGAATPVATTPDVAVAPGAVTPGIEAAPGAAPGDEQQGRAGTQHAERDAQNDARLNTQDATRLNAQDGARPNVQSGAQSYTQDAAWPNVQNGVLSNEQSGTRLNAQGDAGVRLNEQSDAATWPNVQNGARPNVQGGVRPNAQNATRSNEQNATRLNERGDAGASVQTEVGEAAAASEAAEASEMGAASEVAGIDEAGEMGAAAEAAGIAAADEAGEVEDESAATPPQVEWENPYERFQTVRRSRRPAQSDAAERGAEAQADKAPGAGRLMQASAEGSIELDFLVASQFDRLELFDEAVLAYQRVLSRDPGALPVLVRLAELHARLGDHHEALFHIRLARELAPPDDADMRLSASAVYFQLGEIDAAIQVLLDEDDEPFEVDSAPLLYELYRIAERPPQALRVALWLIEQSPFEPSAYIMAAAAYAHIEDYESQARILQSGLDNIPGELSIYEALARRARRLSGRAGELEVLREMRAHHPQNLRVLLRIAETELATGEGEAAERTLMQAEWLSPRDPRASLRLAFMDYERGNYAAAYRRFANVHAMDASDYQVTFFLGMTQRQIGRDADALASLESIPPTSNRYFEARSQAAFLLERLGEYARALGYVDQAIDALRARERTSPSGARDPERLHGLRVYRGNLLFHSGRERAALRYLDSLLVGAERDAEVYFTMGFLHGERRQRALAREFMDKALELRPDYADALNYIGYDLADHGENLDEAERLVRRALELRPDSGHIVDSLGWVYYRRAEALLAAGRIQEAHAWLFRAESELLRADKLTGGNPVILEHIGDVYLALGRDAEALTYYERARGQQGAKSPEQPELAGKIERLRAALPPAETPRTPALPTAETP